MGAMVPANGMEISLSFCKNLSRPIKPYHHCLLTITLHWIRTHLSHHPTCLDNMMDFGTRVSPQIVHALTTVSYPFHNPTRVKLFSQASPWNDDVTSHTHTHIYIYSFFQWSYDIHSHHRGHKHRTHVLLIVVSNDCFPVTEQKAKQ